MTNVAVESRKRLLNQESLHIFQAHFFEARRTFAPYAQAQIGGANRIPLSHQYSPLYGMVQLAYISGPGVRQQHLNSAFIKASELFPVMIGMLTQEMRGQHSDVLTAIAKRGKPDFDGIQPEQQILT